MDDLEREKKWKTVELEGLFRVGSTQNIASEGVSGFALLCWRVYSFPFMKNFSIHRLRDFHTDILFVKISSKSQRPSANYEMGLWSLWVCILNNK